MSDVRSKELDLMKNISDDEDTQKDKFLTFIIDSEYYAIEISCVIEIIGIQRITQVPNIQDYIKGIINLRGNITPVVDVRSRFRIESAEYDEMTCIIVVKLESSSIGLIVDEVSEVLNIPKNIISDAPQTNKGSQSRFIKGIGKLGEDLKIILDINKLLYNENDRNKNNETNE